MKQVNGSIFGRVSVDHHPAVVVVVLVGGIILIYAPHAARRASYLYNYNYNMAINTAHSGYGLSFCHGSLFANTVDRA